MGCAGGFGSSLRRICFKLRTRADDWRRSWIGRARVDPKDRGCNPRVASKRQWILGLSGAHVPKDVQTRYF
jgi:hypothetical protein